MQKFSGNVFVIGLSKSGKTTFAQGLMKLGKYDQHIQGSEWARERFIELTPESPNYREEITKKSLEVFRATPKVCVDFIKKKYDLSRPSVIDGLRNPHDFLHLFDSTKDTVIWLDVLDGVPSNMFDTGVNAIIVAIHFYLQTGIIRPSQVIVEPIRRDLVYEDIQAAIANYCSGEPSETA